MIILPPNFASMGAFNQWTLWRIIVYATGPRKVPVDYDGNPHDPHEPENMLSFVDAAAACERLRLRGVQCFVGFIFTLDDPHFFLDVDHAWDPVKSCWSPIAEEIMRALPGAAFELSWSGTGYHLFGQTSEFMAHGNKRADLGLELYITKRFCAMTFNTPSGSSAAQLTLQYKRVALSFGAPSSQRADLSGFSEPDPDYGGPEDDGQLIEMLRRQTPKPGKATVEQLWTAAEELGQFYPDNDKGRAYEATAADLALCSALAFWTGKDAPRMDRLYRASGLMRPKWDDRPDYVKWTIGLAIAGCNAVYQGKNAPAIERQPGVIDLQLPAPAEPTLTTGYQFLSPEQQIEYFKGYWYVADRHQVLTPRGYFLSPAAFKASMGGYVFAMDTDSGDTTRNAFEALTESRAVNRRIAYTTVFKPCDPPGQYYPELDAVNVYVPANVPSVQGDVGPFIDFVCRMYPDPVDRSILLTYMARLVQLAGTKLQWTVLVQGCEGNGKTLLAYFLTQAIGERYVINPKAADLANKFNAAFQFSLLAIVEEIKQQHNAEQMEALKLLITNERIEFQPKGRDQFTADSCTNLFLTSNFKDGARKHRGDRRICPLFSDQQTPEDIERCGMGGNFFPKLWEWAKSGGAAHVTHYLQNYVVAAEYDPAGSCNRAPISSSTNEAIAVGRTVAEEMINEAIGEGQLGFKGGWISSVCMANLFKHSRGMDGRARVAALESLGYVPHPNLKNGRVTTGTNADGQKKPRLYVKPDTIQAGFTGSDIIAQYEIAQQKVEITPTIKRGAA